MSDVREHAVVVELTMACPDCGGTCHLPGRSHIAGTKFGSPDCWHCTGGRVAAKECPSCLGYGDLVIRDAYSGRPLRTVACPDCTDGLVPA